MVRLRPRLPLLLASLSLFLAPGHTVAGETDERSWQFQKNRDPLGSGFVAVAGTGEGSIRPMVRCWTASSSLDVRFTLAPEQSLPTTDQVLIAFDGKAPVAAKWPRNATRLAMVVPAALQRPLLSQLRYANEMQLTLVTADGGQTTHVIALDGSARAIDQAVANCS